VKDLGKYYAGYRCDNGRYRVYEKDGILRLFSDEECDNGYAFLYRVDLYEDIAGRYFPKIEDRHAQYFKRQDGKVERMEFTEDGSMGRIVEDHRGRVSCKSFSAVSPEEENSI
jgi:hypothetical protein